MFIKRTELYRFEVSDLEYESLKGFLENQLGKKYDWLAILSLGLFKRDWQSETKWFCSELLLTALNKCTSLRLLNTDADAFRVTPRDLYLSPFMNRDTYRHTFYRKKKKSEIGIAPYFRYNSSNQLYG